MCLDERIVRIKDNHLNSFRGYGIIFKRTGWILTSYQIVSDHENIKVEKINEHPLLVELYDCDPEKDLAVLRPSKTMNADFTYLNFIETQERINFPFTSLLLDKNFVISEGTICKKYSMSHRSLTILKTDNLCNRNLFHLGGPIIIENSGKVFCIITSPSVAENIYSSNTLFGIPSDIINNYLRYIDQKIIDAEHRQLTKIKGALNLIIQFKADAELHSGGNNNN